VYVSWFSSTDATDSTPARFAELAGNSAANQRVLLQAVRAGVHVPPGLLLREAMRKRGDTPDTAPPPGAFTASASKSAKEAAVAAAAAAALAADDDGACAKGGGAHRAAGLNEAAAAALGSYEVHHVGAGPPLRTWLAISVCVVVGFAFISALSEAAVGIEAGAATAEAAAAARLPDWLIFAFVSGMGAVVTAFSFLATRVL